MSTNRLETPAARPKPPERTVDFADAKVKPQVRTMVRYGLILYFVMVLAEGVFRKWILPDLNQFIYIAKDVVLLLVCARVIVSLGYIPIPRTLRHSPVGHLFIAFAIYSFCEGFNPLLPHWKLGLWGIRTYVLPMSLVYLVPLGMPDPRMNERYFRLYLLIGIPIALLCFVQYQMPRNHIINKYSNSELGKNVALVSGAVRVSGPFSYITGLTTYVGFQAAGLLGVLFASRWQWKNNKLMWLTLSLTVALIPMTGSRTVAMYFLLYIFIILALSQAVLRGASGNARMVLAGICLAALCIGLFGDALERFAERARVSSDTSDRLIRLISQPFDQLEFGGLFGYGAAATHQAAPVLVPGGESYYWLPKIRGMEEEIGRIVLELGGFGVLLYVALKFSVCATVFNYIRRFGRNVPLTIPVATLLTATSCMITGMIFNSVGSSFYWGMFGLFIAQANATRVVVRKS
jgi:hypothetical protein